jgi:LCP family protein required for cell wall assembly
MPSSSNRPLSTPRRGLAQRAILALNLLIGTSCLVGAGALVYGQQVVADQRKIPALENLARAQLPDGLATQETFPVADPGAQNFLITGADNNACVDPNSPYAAAFGDRSDAGNRSDTIMIIRIDPATSQAAILSLPRDLWVPISGTKSSSRINSAYVKDDPTLLIATIFDNFKIGIDHFIQVDFCAFKTLVDAVGGISVPFEFAARDTHTGLNVPSPGCFNFSGDHALAYVRSRHYETFDEAKNKWTEDPASDLGRISRQQDFIRRVIAKALDTGSFNPTFARGIINTALKYVVIDQDLTVGKLLQFSGVIQNLNPTQLQTYQLEVERKIIKDNDVLIPNIDGRNMKAVLAIFRGQAPLAVPVAIVDPPVTLIATGGTVTSTTIAPQPTVTTVASKGPKENSKGVVPAAGVLC